MAGGADSWHDAYRGSCACRAQFRRAKNYFVLLSSFVVAFGLVKGVMNLLAGRLSQGDGRKRILLLRWLVARPIPVMIWHAPSWS